MAVQHIRDLVIQIIFFFAQVFREHLVTCKKTEQQFCFQPKIQKKNVLAPNIDSHGLKIQGGGGYGIFFSTITSRGS